MSTTFPLTPEQAAFHAWYARERTALDLACALHVARLQALLAQAGGVEVAKVEGRVKDRDECLRKFARKYRPALEEAGTPYEIQHYITDLIGVRVVCLYEDELERVAGIARAHFEVIEVTDKVSAVQATESAFGYKGLHLDLRLHAGAGPGDGHAGAPFELQVRTIIQDAWSVLDHRIKYKKSIPPELKRRINVLSALFELADREFRQIRDATEAELRRADSELVGPEAEAEAAHARSELDAFTFLRIARHFFAGHEFDADRVDLFVEEIRGWAPGITRARFNALLGETLGTVKRYRQFYEDTHPQGSFNAFTVMRHCLYLADKAVFHRALRNSAREAFEAWLRQH
ncbi:GTP pyrophosphokinase [Pulveribacter suum]|uniref:(P)ppGpp synthetase n=1 Tax=Pulveribacter suum TaxID=2116657 RepID=A0A2P1NLC7_9BURK|nr:RelA/SpoT domain-containing protein [Pulveribacter suum]AVP57855.1 (p)ppGpp synthetase [Pulveribacter suum]